jgi:hypothetical protein
MGMCDQPKITKRRQRAIDRGPVNPRGRCLSARNDLVRRQMVISAVEYLNNCLAGLGYALVLVAEQAQRRLDPGCGL